ncbi:MAG: oxidoreductase [Betaproteobacteria bacterium]|nr:oxidoreductase [Betaproteobacteria bacterium]
MQMSESDDRGGSRAARGPIEPGRRRLLGSMGAVAGAALIPAGVRAAPTSSPVRSARARHTLVFLNPGHFHAGLTLKHRHPDIADDVHVYAQDGPDVDIFLRMVDSFNTRAEAPTGWFTHIYRGPDYLARLRADRAGDIVIVAGRNDEKMTSIRALHDDGFHVLGDKPWLIDASELPLLAEPATTPPLAMDIMTERHEVMTRVQKGLADMPDVFGEMAGDDDHPAVFLRGVHHLYKIVNGRPLVRPPWFFDTAVQGEGITDVTTHLVDLAQWFVGGDAALDYERDVDLRGARQWPTVVPPDIFSRITGLDRYPDAIAAAVRDGQLEYLCNARIDYRLRGVPVRIDSLWNLAVPEGGGDTHHAIVRGTRAELVIDQGPDTGHRTRLTIRPVAGGARYDAVVRSAESRLQHDFPGLAIDRDGDVYRVGVPGRLRTSHEAHFGAVLAQFLGYVENGRWPASLGPDLVTKYTLLARAKQISVRA